MTDAQSLFRVGLLSLLAAGCRWVARDYLLARIVTETITNWQSNKLISTQMSSLPPPQPQLQDDDSFISQSTLWMILIILWRSFKFTAIALYN